MRLLFRILSLAYISGLFLLADSSAITSLADFNLYGLLHIPLYGLLTLLLFYSMVPLTPQPKEPGIPACCDARVRNIKGVIEPSVIAGYRLSIRLLTVGFISLVVAIADEIHQAYIPGREAAITDVLLDLLGISFALLFIFKLYEK